MVSIIFMKFCLLRVTGKKINEKPFFIGFLSQNCFVNTLFWTLWSSFIIFLIAENFLFLKKVLLRIKFGPFSFADMTKGRKSYGGSCLLSLLFFGGFVIRCTDMLGGIHCWHSSLSWGYMWQFAKSVTCQGLHFAPFKRFVCDLIPSSLKPLLSFYSKPNISLSKK